MEYMKLTTKSSQTLNTPIIVGERYELAEAVAADCSGELHGGLLAKPADHGALLPMSGYEKPSNVSLSGELYLVCL